MFNLKSLSLKGNLTPKGYIRILWRGRLRMQHDAVWEEVHGPIPEGHVVHHKDEVKTHNEPDNLQLMEFGKHTSFHKKFTHCRDCRVQFVEGQYQRSGRCRTCVNAYQRKYNREHGLVGVSVRVRDARGRICGSAPIP